MGTGKVALQLFLAPSATPQTAERRVYGVELAPSRYARAAAAAERLSGRWPERFRREAGESASGIIWRGLTLRMEGSRVSSPVF